MGRGSSYVNQNPQRRMGYCGRRLFIPRVRPRRPPAYQSIIWYGGNVQVLQCTQFAALIFSFTPPFASWISYTLPDKILARFPYSRRTSSAIFCPHVKMKLTSHALPSDTRVSRSNVSLPFSFESFRSGPPLIFCILIPGALASDRSTPPP